MVWNGGFLLHVLWCCSSICHQSRTWPWSLIILSYDSLPKSHWEKHFVQLQIFQQITKLIWLTVDLQLLSGRLLQESTIARCSCLFLFHSYLLIPINRDNPNCILALIRNRYQTDRMWWKLDLCMIFWSIQCTAVKWPNSNLELHIL